MLYQNNFLYKNTIVHRAHPVLKTLIFLSIILLLFLKISLFVYICIFLLTLAITFASQCHKILYKKMIFFYFGLFLFLITINWFFNKNPGFWVNQSISNFFGKATEWKMQESSTASVGGGGGSSGINNNAGIIYDHGWFLGGDIVKDTSNKIASASSRNCLKKIANINPDNCSDTNVTANSSGGYSNYSEKNLKIIKIMINDKAQYFGFFSKWYTFTAFQIILAFNLTNKLITVILLSSVLIMTTSMPDLAYALEDLFKPLKIIKLPAEEMALILAISLRFTPSLLQESFRIIKAQASRGIDFKNGKIKDKIISILSLFVPLFIVSFIKSDELARAMTARGYIPKSYRTSHRIHNINLLTIIMFFFIIAFLSFLYVFHFKNFLCMYFGQVEYLLTIAK